jgi:endonuclease/exonuclease/phosphatase family metal-dependent hydrolase
MRITTHFSRVFCAVTAALIILGCSPKPVVSRPTEPTADPSNADPSNAESSNAESSNAEPNNGLDLTVLAPLDDELASTTTAQNKAQPDDRQPSSAASNTVRFLAWNVESGGNDPAVISEQLATFQGYDVICLSEVSQRNFERYASALLNQYHEVHGDTGRADRLQIFVKKERYDLLASKELSQHRDHILNTGNHRSPLFVRIRDKQSKQHVIVMTNHLARGNAEFRQQQAAGLREWARDQNVPVIALGDFNMDYDYRTMKGNAAFEEMVRDNVWSWLAPDDFIDTNWSDRDGDGNDNYPDSMLDLAFAAGAAKEWGIECRVIVRPNDFPDDQSTSDHRPIELVYTR